MAQIWLESQLKIIDPQTSNYIYPNFLLQNYQELTFGFVHGQLIISMVTSDNRYKIMINKKAREEPFHVRRVRLKQSIVKSNQMLENLTCSEHKLKKFRAITEPVCEQQEGHELRRKYTYNSSMVNEIDLLNLKVSRSRYNQIKFAVHASKNNRYKMAEQQMQENGLEAIKIKAMPSSKNIFNHKFSYERRLCKESFEQFNRPRNIKLKTLRTSASPELPRKNRSLQKYNLDYTSNNDLTNRGTTNYELNKSHNIKMERSDVEPLKHQKVKHYLYQKMKEKDSKDRDRSNLVYQKRIKSYTDFIWKLLLAHNVYLELDLSSRWNHARLKAYIGKGNNCNMIRGLIKRRFWWTITDQLTDDCTFVWSQLKINKIYERQQFTYENLIQYAKEDAQKNLQAELLTKSNKKLSTNLYRSIKKVERQKFNKNYGFNKKIWNESDQKGFEKIFFEQVQKVNREQGDQTQIKQINYKELTKKINQNYKSIVFIDNLYAKHDGLSEKQHNYYQTKPIIHNHLQNNFLLGNKKALFYNLREYYQKIGEDLFDYIPLTFHIKAGFKDPQYKNFVSHYNQIKLSHKQSLEKEKNIWIVKPGENSNRGNGIQVIDEIYQFDNIIKKSEKRLKKESINEGNSYQGQTFIIQKYIERPLLYYDRKFDIRHYMLITNLYGVTRAYWYEQGYIRTSSCQFSVDSFDPQIHLTNDAVQKDYTQYGKYQSHNKVSYNQFQTYLNLFPDKKLNFRQQILPQMKKMATDAAKSVYLKISPKQQMHNFQIFGLDFMIDRKFKPWLIEINTNPCLQCQSPLLNRIIPYMVEQSLKLSLDLIYPPPSHYPSLWKHNAPLIDFETFKYELIFDSLSEGEVLKQLYSTHSGIHTTDIGFIEDDECFRDDGKQIKLQDFT